MGNGASMEEDQPPAQGTSGLQRTQSVKMTKADPNRQSAKSNRSSMLSRTGSTSGTWKTALKSNSLAATGLRKMRAAALGRKSACTVAITKTGFSLQHIQICEGQVVTYEWWDQENKGFNVTQVVHDGEQYKSVIGGFNSGPVQKKGFYEQQFNHAGEYKFVSAGLRCTPLTIEVYPRKDVEAELSDDGFFPKLIRVDEGNSIRWSWSGCSVPHSVFEVRFSHKTGTIVNKDSHDRPIPTKAGSYKQTFNKPGMYYFQSEGYSSGEMFTCMVHVRERQREYNIKVMDRMFSPPIIVIEEGDRLWWSWDKKDCKKPHCVYQIEPPPLNHPSDESYKPKKNGFKWPAPSRCGMVSAEFFEPGVFYYSDHNFEEAAEYIGTIIVKPKQIEHFVELNREGFIPDLIYAHTGDRIWWTWTNDEVDANFTINEIEKCISPIGGRQAIENEASGGEGSYMDADLENLKVSTGLETVQLGSIGVYHYRVSDSPNNISTVSIIVNGGPKNHTIHVTDQGFEPKVVTIHPGDRIWWVWQDGAKQHNIIQVSHQGKHIPKGFCSGAPTDSPSAYMCQFDTTGVYYYVSDALAKSFGAIVVTSQPEVHEIQVSGTAIDPDPVPINVNDVVAWTFRGLKQHNVQQVDTVDQVLDAQFNSSVVPPRRSMNKLFTDKGVFHYTSKSFLKQGKRSQETRSDETRISSVLVDELSDSAVVRIDSKGFHPDQITIIKGQSVLWTWKESGDEAHNIIHVNNPNSDAPLGVIQGDLSFNSGRPVPQNSFLYTFEEPGKFCVASQGAPGYAGNIHVLDEDTKVKTPTIVGDMTSTTMDKFAVVKLHCDTPGAIIYYTLDGTAPEPQKLTAKVYDSNKGCVLKKSGLCFVRAMAVATNYTNSEVFTSRRLWVLTGADDESEPEPEPEPEKEDPDRWHWWNCVPTIKGVFTQSGTLEVFWDPPPEESRHLIRSYQVYLNGVSYCAQFPPIYNSVNISGLAGGRMYEVVLEVYPIDSMFLPHKSNKLAMKCVQTTSAGGPVLSLEVTEKPDAMAIVWMSISTPHNPIEGYRVYLNGQMCGNQVVPEENSDRCKVVIEGCQADFPYKVVVAAVPSGGGSPKMSNEMEVQLPLSTRHIVLPPVDIRSDDDDLYREFIEVREGDQQTQSPDQSMDGPGQTVTTFDLTNEDMSKPNILETHPEDEQELLDPASGSSEDVPEEDMSEQGELYQGGGQKSQVTQGSLDYGNLRGSLRQLALQYSVEQSSGQESHYNEETDEFEEEEEGYSPPPPPSEMKPPAYPRSQYLDKQAQSSPFASLSQMSESSQYPYNHDKCSRPSSVLSQKQMPPSPVKNKKVESFPEAPLSLASKPTPPIEPLSSASPAKKTLASLTQKYLPAATHEEPPRNKNQSTSYSNSSKYLSPPEPQMPPAGTQPPPLPSQSSEGTPQPLQPRAKPPSWQALGFASKAVRSYRPGQHTAVMRPPPAPKTPEELNRLGYQVNWLPEFDPAKPQWYQDEKTRAKAAAMKEGYEPEPMAEEAGCGFIDATQGPWKNKMKIASDSIRATKRMKQDDTEKEDGKNKESYEGHCTVEVEDDEEEDKAPYLIWPSEKKKKKKKTAVVAVNEEAHLSLPEKEKPRQNVVATVPVQLGLTEGQDDFLPVPIVSAQNSGADTAQITWHFERSAEPLYRLLVNVVNIIGVKFNKDVNSDISFECLHDETGEGAVAAVQHSWNVTSGNQCNVKGLSPGVAYNIYVVANYAYNQSQQPCEIQAKSTPIKYTTLGPPMSPILKTLSVDLNQVCLTWDAGECHPDVTLTGYQVYIDGAPLGPPLKVNCESTTIDQLQPGRTIKVSVVALTDHPVGNSHPSNTVKVTCPHLPPAPPIAQQPSYKKGSVIVAWNKPPGTDSVPYGEDIVFYRVYVDGTIHGEVKATQACDRNGYQYYLSNLSSGQSYDVQIKSYAGQYKVDPTADQVYCLCESEGSNNVPSMCPAPPMSPILRIEGMNLEGIDVTWEMPQQFGDAVVSGYQMLKNGKLYGSIIPPDVHSLRIKGVSLGESLDLQILALTDHPVGRATAEGLQEGDSGIGASSQNESDKGPSEIFLGDRYSACTPGPKLRVHYSGLVQPPSKVWCEQVTGHSALIVWSKDEKPKQHYLNPESYQVTWWPGDKADKDINSQSTKDDHLLLTGLRPSTQYSVVVEAREMQKYAEVDESSGVPNDGFNNTFILTAKSDRLTVETARPPKPPTNLGVVATTCNSIQVQWDPPTEMGVEVIGIRVDAVAMKNRDKTKHASVEVMPDARSAVIDGLQEKTEYLLSITAVTEEYFEQLPQGHELRRTKVLPRNKPPREDPWLPSTSVLATTSGTEPPTEVTVIKTTIDSVTFGWKHPRVHGSNRLQGTIIRWAEAKFSRGENSQKQDDTEMVHHRSVAAEGNEATIEGLCPGLLYKFIVEAVVSVKNVLDTDRQDPEAEKQNRRTTHVQSKPVFIRTRAPCEPPRPVVTGYSTNTIQLYWEKPLLYYQIGKNEDDNPKYLKLYLEGYRIEINGKPHMRLSPTAQNCTLVKCKAGKTYTIVLYALTCTEDCRREKKRRNKGARGSLDESATTVTTNKTWESMLEEFENDESPSAPLEVTLPRLSEGLLGEVQASFIMPASGPPKGTKEGEVVNTSDFGDIQCDWAIQDTDAKIEQYNITWHCLADGAVQQRCADTDIRSHQFPALQRKTLYDIVVEPKYKGETVLPGIQHVGMLIPGPPDPPEIWLRNVDTNEFVIEWGEPRLYGVKIGGYQVYLNQKKVGNILSVHHRKAVIPCKPNKEYKVALIALSSDPRFGTSGHSNTLVVSTGSRGHIHSLNDDDLVGQDENELIVKVIRVTDSSVHLDWSPYIEMEGMMYYRVVWSSVAQPAEREVKLPSGEKSCVIHKCFPGTCHFIRIYAMGSDDQVLDRSRQITAQTSAAPDPPFVTLRACNFKYIAIQWEKPSTYGDALVSGYKVYVNGVVEALLGADQFTYSFTHGKWCREYVFQVQALTAVDKLHSKTSEPLVVIWPGVQPPVLRRAPAVSGNSVKVIWDSPYCTDGVKIKQYKVVVLDEVTERPSQVISPIHPDTTEAEIHGLKQGTYIVYLEVHLHGSSEVVKSDILRIVPMITPDPPQISVTVIGLEERRQIEKVTCDLINKRDRLLNVLASRDPNTSHRLGGDEEQALTKAVETLGQVEEMLDDCLLSLQHYTGHLLAHVSWTSPQSNPDIRVTGFKVLVDGKQYGTTLHSGIKNVRIKLGLAQASHHISMVSVCERPSSMSVVSNVVELLTEPFLPFSFYNFLSHNPKVNKNSSLTYQESLSIERKSQRKPINQGLLKRRVPPPACTLIDIFEGEYRPLFPPSGPRAPTALLFWSKWCYASQKMLGWFVKYARSHTSQYEFIAVACCGSRITASERQDLVQCISDNGWREDSCIRHVVSQSSNYVPPTSPEKKGHDCYSLLRGPPASAPGAIISSDGKVRIDGNTNKVQNGTSNGVGMSSDVCELFGVHGVPTIVVVHPQDYIAWKGRYSAFDYAQYEHFLNYVFAQTMAQSPPWPDPWDTDIDSSVLDGATKKRVSERDMLIHRPTGTGSLRTTMGSTATTIHLNGMGRPQSAKRSRLFVKTNTHTKKDDQLTVNSRPYSANWLIQSPYSQKLNSSPPRRVKSGRKVKSTS